MCRSLLSCKVNRSALQASRCINLRRHSYHQDSRVTHAEFDMEDSRDHEYETIRDYEFSETTEFVTRYASLQAYLFVKVTDVLIDRYRILCKLGFGRHSTTWLVRDSETQRICAVKVGTARPKRVDDRGIDELEILTKMRKNFAIRNPNLPNAFPFVLDHFVVEGPFGLHSCYVREAARAAICTSQAGKVKDHVFEPDIGRSLAAQVVMSIASMHREGYVHHLTWILQG